MTNSYDIAIIGSGLGGLSCGAMLAKEGLRVCVLEQHSIVGGCLQSFKRNGIVFDTGIHYIGSMGEGQIMRQFLKYYGIIDQINIQPVSTEAYETVCLDHEQYSLPIGVDRFIEVLGNQFPTDKDGLRILLDKIMEVKNSISVTHLKQGRISDTTMQKYLAVSAYDVISQYIQNPKLRCILGGASLLFGGEQSTATFYHYAMVMGSNIEGAYRIVGGTQSLANALSNVITEHGGVVMTNAEVTHIVTNGTNSVQHLQLSDGRQIEAKQYISSIHPQITFSLVDKTPVLKRVFLERIAELRNTYGFFTTYIALKQGALPYRNTFYLVHANNNSWFSELSANEAGNASLMLSFKPSVDGRYAESAAIITPIAYAEVEKWSNTTMGHRGADYEMWKKQLAEHVIDRANDVCSGLTDAVSAIYTSSPLTFYHYTHTPKGSAYGLLKNCQNPLPTIIPAQTKLHNLLLTGQSIFVPGAIGVTMTAAITCACVVGEEYLAKKIAEA